MAKTIKRVPTVYLAGAIEACKTKKDTHGWRASAEWLLKEAGFKVLCPICDGVGDFFGKKLNFKQITAIVREDLDFVRKSDYVLVNGTLRSEGTAMEVYVAHTNTQKSTMVITYGLGDDQRTFVRYHSDYCLEDLDTAIAAIIGAERSLHG